MKFIHALLITISFSTILSLPVIVSAGQIEEIQRSAEQGDVKSQSHLGYLYYVGEGVPKDYALAVKWYAKAAEQGDRDAQYNLAVAYAFGEGTTQDQGKAATWYRRAALQSHKIAQYSLGLSYIYGEGVPQDSQQAAYWFEKSALQGYSRAQVHLASMFHVGDGIEQNFSRAVEWYRKAADRGDQTAQYNLGSLYRSGKGVEQNLAQAKRWFRLAADQGYAPAQNELASLSFKPVHTEQTIPVVQSREPSITSESIAEEKQAAPVIKTTNTAEEKTLATAEPKEPVAVEETKTTFKEVKPTIFKSTTSNPAEAELSATNEEQVADTDEAESESGFVGFFKKIFEPSQDEEQLEIAGTREETSDTVLPDTVYIPQEDGTTPNVINEPRIIKTENKVADVSEDLKKAEEIEPVVVETSAIESVDEPVVAEEILPKDIQETEIEEPVEQIVADEDKNQGIGGFFSRLFGGGEKQSEGLSIHSEDEITTAYVEHDQPVSSEVKDYVDTIEIAETVTPDTSESNAVIVQTTRPIPNLQPGPVTDIVINYDKQIEAGQAALLDEDFAAALKHFKPAAIQGNSTAQSYLASMYYTGSGVPQDYGQAFNWYRRAAEQGDANSQYSIGNMYLLGEGVNQDDRLAYNWYSMAADQGHEKAQNNVAKLERTVTNKEPLKIAEGNRSGTDKGLPSFIDDLFKPEKTSINNEETATSNKNAITNTPAKTATAITLAKTETALVPAKTETAIKSETTSVATVYPLDDYNDSGIEQEIIYFDESVPTNNVSSDLAVTEKKEQQGELFDQLFDSNQEQLDVVENQESINSPSATEIQENTEDATTAATDVAVEEEATKEDESSLLSFFNSIFSENKAKAENETKPVDNKTGLIVQAPADTSVEIEKPARIEDFETNDDELNAIHTKAVQGDSLAQYELANRFYGGKGLDQDYAQAFTWYRRSAQQGDKDAQYKLGNLYLMGEGVDQNDREAMRWYEMAANQGHEAAQHNFENLEKMPPMVVVTEEAESVAIENTEGDDVLPLDDSDEQAEEGAGFFSSLKNALGFNGGKTEDKTETDEVEAVETIYISNNDDIIEEDSAAETVSVEEIASNLEPADEIIVATIQEPSETVVETSTTIEETYRPEDDYQKGLAYTYGDGIAINHEKAFEHFHKAAEAGLVTAQYRVATAYAYGEGVEKNQEKAAGWYEKAATKGDPLAQRQLAMLYWSGKGVTKDKAMAHAWYSIIADNGNNMDRQRLDHIQQEMTSEELTKSKQIADSLSNQ